LPLRKVSPLRAIRADFSTPRSGPDWPLRGLAIGSGLAIAAFAMTRTPVWWHGLAFVGGLSLALLIFWAAAVILKSLVRRLVRPRSFLLRQASANLHRPQNKTVYLTVSLGLGTFLIYTLTLVQTGLLQQSELADTNEAPNLLFFDIQPDQMAGLEDLLAARDLELATASPVVTMRLVAVKGVSAAAIFRARSPSTTCTPPVWMLPAVPSSACNSTRPPVEKTWTTRGPASSSGLSPGAKYRRTSRAISESGSANVSLTR
jgi:putative ABC transport system permease protein